MGIPHAADKTAKGVWQNLHVTELALNPGLWRSSFCMFHRHFLPPCLGLSCLLGIATAGLHAAAPPLPAFRAVNVDTNIAIGYGVTVADIDGDRRPDLILCDKNQIAWYQNPGWQKHVIAENLTKLDHVCVAAQDIDGDGKAELAVGAGWNPGDTVNSGAVFYLQPPADRTRPWKPIPLPHEPTVHRMRWVKDYQDRWTLLVVPLHGRGNKDGEGVGVKIQRHVPPASADGEWTIQAIDDSLHKTHNFDPVQWDDDVAQEFLLGSKEGWSVVNWSREKSGYVLESLGSAVSGGAGEIRLGRAANNGRFVATVEPMHGNSLVLYTPPASASARGAHWTRRVLDESLIDGHALACGDLLGIGRDQIVVGWRAMNRPGAKVGLKLLTSLDAAGQEWRTTLLDDNTMACEDLCLADLNGDGKLDIIAAGRATRNLKVYLNERP